MSPNPTSKLFAALGITLVALSSACRSTEGGSTPSQHHRLSIAHGDPATREKLMGFVTRLEGRWTTTTEGGETAEIVFERTSAGHAVKETMFPGSPHEMVNMYTLDGNQLVMTHYCGAGNQPRMRARRIENGRMPFRFESVSDLNDEKGLYMGELELVRLDENHVEERWRSFVDGKLNDTMVISLTRKP